MKRILVLLVVISLVTVACQKDNVNNPITSETNEGSVTINDDVIENDGVNTQEDAGLSFDDAVDGVDLKKGAYSIGETRIRFSSKDGAMITGDLSLIDHTSPMILLFHRASWSRGEYIETAKKLNELGYNTLAVDQRSGGEINDVENLTFKRLSDQAKVYTFKEAIIDIEATIEYASNRFEMPLIALGSSYSASILCVIGQDYYDDLQGLILFSPGENMYFDNQPVSAMASELMLPIFMTCGSHETFEPEQILAQIPSEYVTKYYPERLRVHGSELLWEATEQHEMLWDHMMIYIEAIMTITKE